MNLSQKIALAAGLAGLASAASASVLYTEAFANTSGSDKALSYVGWNFVTATNSSSAITATTNTHGVVHAGLGSDQATNGYIYTQPGANGGTRVFTDTGLSSTTNPGLTVGNVGTISFDAAGTNSQLSVQILVQVADTWYVSSQAFSLPNTTSASFATAATNGTLSYSLDFTTATWSSVSFDVGSTLSVGASAVLPESGDITGIGLLVKNNHSSVGSTVRLDNLVVTSAAAVPEPSAAAVLAGAAALAGVALRRRRSVR